MGIFGVWPDAIVTFDESEAWERVSGGASTNFLLNILLVSSPVHLGTLEGYNNSVPYLLNTKMAKAE